MEEWRATAEECTNGSSDSSFDVKFRLLTCQDTRVLTNRNEIGQYWLLRERFGFPTETTSDETIRYLDVNINWRYWQEYNHIHGDRHRQLHHRSYPSCASYREYEGEKQINAMQTPCCSATSQSR
ncbi:unnamed protein product [Anisakis simplex]|uniref:NAC domain-containing protein n=1 Tax=Anisakis simplex TaxID=6269 RepID=A0A0M3K5F4_ANISI|nr:unnamed protein product [Anisakis simplex]